VLSEARERDARRAGPDKRRTISLLKATVAFEGQRGRKCGGVMRVGWPGCKALLAAFAALVRSHHVCQKIRQSLSATEAQIQRSERLAADLKLGAHSLARPLGNRNRRFYHAEMNEDSKAVSFVLCLSAHDVLSPWMSRNAFGLARQLNGENVKLLPVRLTGGSPLRFWRHQIADAVKDYTSALAELVAVIEK